jgi:hypothetical protein
VAHGTPDYGVTAGSLTRYQMLDLGELAARLGSPDTHDRRGDVVWWDDAECGAAKWSATLIGVNASFGADTARARNGRSSYKLRPGDAIGDVTTATHMQPISQHSRYGFEFSFSYDGNIPYVDWWHRHFDGAAYMDFRVRWDGNLKQLQYEPAGGGFTAFASGVDLYAAPTLFHTGKMVIDPLGGSYHRFILNDVSYDMHLFTGASTPSVVPVHHELVIRAFNNSGFAQSVWVDDIILTENEPANP